MIGLRVRAAPPGAFTAPGPIGRTVSKQSMSHRAVPATLDEAGAA
jgi:hypothetical protein